MSVRQIDEALRLWKDRLNAAAQNLIDLQAHPVYKRVSAPGTRLAGETAEKSALAVRTLGLLLQYFDLLNGVIARAEELRVNMPAIFGAEEREREIVAMLRGRSIKLPSIQVPFGQRSLLGGVENSQTISPPDLIRVMESAFEQTKQIVLQLDAAWESIGRSIDDSANQLSLLRANADDLPIEDRKTLESAAAQLAQIQERASDDPLGPAAKLVASLRDTIAAVASRLELARRELGQLQNDFAAANELLNSLQKANEAATAVCAEASEKTDFTIDLGGRAEKMSAIAAWLERLRTARNAPGSILVGLRNWTAAAQQLLNAEQELAGQAGRQLAARTELRGRFDALKAKARAYGLAEHNELRGIAEAAKKLLYERPTPLGKAAACVSDYEAKLNSEAAKPVLGKGTPPC